MKGGLRSTNKTTWLTTGKCWCCVLVAEVHAPQPSKRRDQGDGDGSRHKNNKEDSLDSDESEVGLSDLRVDWNINANIKCSFGATFTGAHFRTH